MALTRYVNYNAIDKNEINRISKYYVKIVRAYQKSKLSSHVAASEKANPNNAIGN